MKGQIANILLGIWIMTAPAVLKFEQSTLADTYHIVGPLVITFAVIALSECTRNVRKANILLGVILVAMPWVLETRSFNIVVNSTIVGLLVLFCSFDRGRIHSTFGGGWSSLWSDDIPEEQRRDL